MQMPDVGGMWLQVNLPGSIDVQQVHSGDTSIRDPLLTNLTRNLMIFTCS